MAETRGARFLDLLSLRAKQSNLVSKEAEAKRELPRRPLLVMTRRQGNPQ